MDNYLEVRHLSKAFPEFHLRDISFSLPPGYIMGLIGPNGSGKTTTIKLILNMLKRESGEIFLMGMDNLTHEKEIKSELAVVFDSNCFCGDWKVSQIENYISVFYKNWNSGTFSRLIRSFQLSPEKKVSELSRGMQMKLMLACAFSYGARLLILDEPTSGLDPVSRDELLTILSRYIEDGEHSVLFSTHITTDLERAADYITYINDGSLFFSGEKNEFLDMFRLVKGGPGELTGELKSRLLGLRIYSTGFEGLIRTEDLKLFSHLTAESPAIDDIMVFTNQKEGAL